MSRMLIVSVLGAPQGCGESFLSDTECATGTYCNGGACTDAAGQCGSSAECTPNGRCLPVFGDGGVSMGDGSACQEWRGGYAELEAVFPCDAVLVQ